MDIKEISFPYKSQTGKMYAIHTLPSGKWDYAFRTSKTFFVHEHPLGTSREHLAKFKLIIIGHRMEEFSPEIKEIILSRMGLSILFKELDKDNIPKQIERTIHEDEFTIKPHNWFISYPKMCSYRIKKSSKWFCTAETTGEAEVLEHKCEKCSLPEDFLRCKHLILKANFLDNTKKTYNFECRLGKQIQSDNPYNCTSPAQPCLKI